MDFFNTRKTKNALDEWLSKRPQGSDSYSQAIGSALAAAVGRQPAAQAYNPATDSNVQASRQNYRLMAQAAADTAAAGTKALSGGYNADYADSAAAQGYEQLLPGQYDNEQALRQLALQSISAENAAADAGIAGLLGAQQLEMGANQMAQAQWEAQRDYLTNEANMAQADQDNFWSNVLNGLMWAADVAMQTYDNYKGYTQQEREWQAYLDQLALENERYEQEYADSRADAAWEQAMAQEQWEAQQAQVAWEQAMAQEQWEAQKAQLAAGYGGSGSPSLDVSDLLKIRQARSDAALTGNDEDVAFYDGLLALYGFSEGMPNTAGGSGKSLDLGFAAARDSFRYGATVNQVVESLTSQGYTQEEIAEIMNRFGQDLE